jgi:hypothetical protein
MALQETQLVVQFRGGVETKEDRKGVLPTKLLALENAVFTKVLTTTKRYGYDDLGQTVMGSEELTPPGRALGKRGAELLMFAADKVYSRASETEQWVEAGEMRSVIASHSVVAKTGTNQTMAECAVNAGVAVHGWEDSIGGVWYSLLDDATGRTLVAPTQASETGIAPRCIALGGFLYLAYALAPAHEVRLLRFSASSPTAAPVERVIVTDLHGTVPVYDWAHLGDDAVIAWNRDTGGIRLAYLHETGVIGGTGLGLPLPVTVSAAVASTLAVCTDDSTNVVLAWSDAAFTVKYETLLAADLSAVHAARTVSTGTADATQMTVAFDGRESDAGDATLWVFWELSAAEPQDYMVKASRVDIDATTLTEHDSWTQRGCGLASKAFQHDEDAFVHLGRDSALYRTYYTLRARERLVCTRLLSGLGNGHLERAHLPSVWLEDAAWYWPAIYVNDIETDGGAVFSESGIRKVSLEFESDEALRNVELGATAYVAGGFLHAYDGARVVEAEFHYGIDDVAAPALGSPAGTGIASGTYNYVFVPENVLANGEVIRGPVSEPVVVTIASGPDKVTFQVPTYRLTAMAGVRIGAYRTLTGDASSYYRVSSFDPTTLGDVNGYIANDTTADTVEFVDEMTDAVLETQDPLYINGGVLSNDPLGGARLVASGKGRVFVVDAAEPNTVFASQELSAGYAIETSPRLRIEVERNGGPITGIVVLGESLLIFKESALYKVTGPGPLANPDFGGGWSPPELVPSDVGCISPDSIGYTALGVLFQSRKGVRLYDGAQVTYVGAPVEAFNAQDVSACTLLEDRSELRLLTADGFPLLYDYERDQWSYFTNHEGLDAVVVGGTYHYLRTNGRVWRETAAYADGGTAQIRQGVETAWCNLVGHKQGQMVVWWVTVLGEFKSAHTLRVRIAYDYQDGWVGDPIDIDPTEGRDEGAYGEGVYGAGPYGGGADTRYQFAIHIGQECQAIRFRFEDIEADGDYGASFELTELHISGGVERSNFTVEEARRY